MTDKLTALKKHHIIDLYPRVRGDVLGSTLDELMERAEYSAKYGVAYAYTVDNRTVAVGGVMKVSEHVGHAWIMGSSDIPKHGRQFTKLLLEQRDSVMKHLNIHRLQGEVLASEPKWCRWAELFGMRQEGLMRQYTDDKQDCVRVAYIKED